jgi:hypothetical protein
MRLADKHINLYKEIQSRGLGRGCSDLNKNEINMLSQEEWNELCKAIWDYLKDSENYEEDRVNVDDWMVVGYITHHLIDFYMKNSIYST